MFRDIIISYSFNRRFGRYEVGGQAYFSPSGDVGTVDGPTPTPEGMYKVNRLRGWGLEAKVVVDSANY